MRAVSRIVCKFGGSSVASAEQLAKVRAIVQADSRRRVVVVSAPGKRERGEAKVTDLLYLCHKLACLKQDFSGPFQTIRSRFVEIQEELGLGTSIQGELDALEQALRGECTADFVASRGEYLLARLAAEYLQAEFIEPADCIHITPTGTVAERTYEELGARLSDERRLYVIPGFYGVDAAGAIKTFSRGGSDISGAIAARAVRALVYENWTDVSGFLMADPRVIPDAKPMLEVTYRELRELSYMGASVLHDEATLPVREVNIPIHIKNTNDPSHPGTRIVQQLSQEVDKATEIAGLAGRRGFSMIALEKSLMNKEVGFAYRLLGIFERRGISVEHCPSSIDGLNVILDSAALGDSREAIVDEIKRTLLPDRISFEPELALIAVVGEGMSRTIGMAAKVFVALRDARVNVRVINQGASELNIIVGVAPEDFEPALRALYAAFVPPA
jgi:aspartate kinase